MGLDQSLRMVRKPNEEDLEEFGKHFAEESHLASFNLDEIRANGDYGLIADLEPYAVVVRGKCHGFDERLLRADFDIPEDASVWGICGSQGETRITYGRTDGQGNSERFVATYDDARRQRYVTVEEADFLVCEMSEIHTLRKRYDVQEVAYDHLPVENCGYYVMDDEAIAAVAACGIDLDGYETDDEQAVVYWEWY